jgi:hypothetical protein
MKQLTVSGSRTLYVTWLQTCNTSGEILHPGGENKLKMVNSVQLIAVQVYKECISAPVFGLHGYSI